jgi:hypothetical protein
LFPGGVVGADEQVADDDVLGIAERGDGYYRRELAAVLPDLRYLVNVFDATVGLEHQCLEAWLYGFAELLAEGPGSSDQLHALVEVRRRDLVHHFGRGVAQHPLGANVEDLDHTIRIRRDAGEGGAVEYCALQRTRPQQRLGASHFGSGTLFGGGGAADDRRFAAAVCGRSLRWSHNVSSGLKL